MISKTAGGASHARGHAARSASAPVGPRRYRLATGADARAQPAGREPPDPAAGVTR